MSICTKSPVTGSKQVPSELIIGRKYYPVAKTDGSIGLESSNVWKDSKKPYLFYAGFNGNHCFDFVNDGIVTGDFFNPEDVYELFELGDTVKLDPRSTHGFGEMNPLDTNGTIIDVELGELTKYNCVSTFIYTVEWSNGNTNSYQMDDLIIVSRVGNKPAKKTRNKSAKKQYTVDEKFIKEAYEAANYERKIEIKKQFPDLFPRQIFEFADGKLNAGTCYNGNPIMIARGIAPQHLKNKSFVLSDEWELKSEKHNGRTLYYFQSKI